MNDKQLLDTLHKLRIKNHSKMFEHYYDPGMDLEDSQIFLLDEDRCIGGDTEDDVGKGNNRYVELIKDFSKASNANFLPCDIKETWASEKGPITVSFTENNKPITFNPEYTDDWLSMKAFEVIKKQFEKNGKEKFYFYLGRDGWGLGQDYLFVRLRTSQKDSIQNKFGWKFAD